MIVFCLATDDGAVRKSHFFVCFFSVASFSLRLPPHETSDSPGSRSGGLHTSEMRLRRCFAQKLISSEAATWKFAWLQSGQVQMKQRNLDILRSDDFNRISLLNMQQAPSAVCPWRCTELGKNVNCKLHPWHSDSFIDPTSVMVYQLQFSCLKPLKQQTYRSFMWSKCHLLLNMHVYYETDIRY